MDVIETLFLIARGGRYIAVDTCRLVDELVVTIYAVEFNRLPISGERDEASIDEFREVRVMEVDLNVFGRVGTRRRGWTF